MREWFKGLLCPNSGISSKRFCGILGWFVTIGIIVYCTVIKLEAPKMIEIFVIAVMSLLGIDSVTSIFKKDGTMYKKSHKKDESE